MDEKEEIRMAENMEKIKNLSQIMGGETEFKSDDVLRAMEMARKLKPLLTANQEQEASAAETPSVYEPVPPAKEVRILRAAMPFLDKEYQKDVFFIMKLLELRGVGRNRRMKIQSREEVPEKRGDRRAPLLSAIRPYLSQDEQKQVDGMLQFMKMKDMMKIMQVLSKEEL